jgi:hypothetical protein
MKEGKKVGVGVRGTGGVHVLVRPTEIGPHT